MGRLVKIVANEEYKVHPSTGFYYIDNDNLVDPNTGEIYKVSDVENIDATDKSEYNKKLKDLMFEKRHMAYEDYPDEKYHDSHGKVNPFVIAYVEHLNDFPYMSSAEVADCICSTIRELNKKYWFDKKNYDYISETTIRKYDMAIRGKRNQMSLFECISNIFDKYKSGGINNNQYKTGNKRILNVIDKRIESDISRFDNNFDKAIADFNYRMKVENAGIEVCKSNGILKVNLLNPFIKNFDLSSEFNDELNKCFNKYGYEITGTNNNGKCFIVDELEQDEVNAM